MMHEHKVRGRNPFCPLFCNFDTKKVYIHEKELILKFTSKRWQKMKQDKFTSLLRNIQELWPNNIKIKTTSCSFVGALLS